VDPVLLIQVGFERKRGRERYKSNFDSPDRTEQTDTNTLTKEKKLLL
jgi:hypothetical protein